LLEAVLPVWDRDVERARLLARSLEKYRIGIDRLWVVASESVLATAAEIFADVVPTVAVPEAELVPELRKWRTRLRPRLSGAARPGYRAQQLIKLGAAQLVESAFYLTLDADIVVVGDVRDDWLIRDGRARCVRFSGQGHRNWYGVASEVLALPASRWEHGVTPCLLSRDCSLGLLTFLEQPAEERDVDAALQSKGDLTGRWRSLLLSRNDWTEYTLYHTFVESASLFDRVHFAVEPNEWYGANVWSAGDWDSWRADQAFDTQAPHRFAVLGSKAGRSADWIAAELAPFL
jgi:hypothetical protein